MKIKVMLKVCCSVVAFAWCSVSFAATVIEFYNTNLDNYFITADAAEATAIDNGSAGTGWIRTGYNFESGSGTSPVCRFSGWQTHYYTIDADVCAYLKQIQLTTPATENRWVYEGIAFNSTPRTNFACPAGSTPIYAAFYSKRVNGLDSVKRRITSSQVAIQEVLARGWTNEGVVMCSTVTPASASTCNTIAYASPYFPVGDYSIVNNTWGKGAIPDSSFSQCISGSPIMTNGLQTGIAAQVNWDWPTYTSGPYWGSVKSYPEIIYRPGGQDMKPIALSNIGNLILNHDITISATGLMYGSASIFHELFLDPLPVGRSAGTYYADVMITLQRFQPYPRPVYDVTTINGNVYDVILETQPNGTPNGMKVIFFESKVPLLKASLPLKLFFNYIFARGILPQNLYLNSIEVGMEITDGAGLLTVNSYSVASSSSVMTSYDYFKGIGLTPQALPRSDLARAYLDIDGDGVPELFSAQQRYSFSQTPLTATPARFMFYQRQPNGSYVELPALLPAGTDGCIHPRKAVVADFNGDGRLDVFVACHGWDQAPFPGERNKVVLSQPDGTYRIQDASTDVGFFHGAAAADFNGDGKPDVVVTNNFTQPSVQVWLNDGSGRFTRSSGYLPAALNVRANYFTVETPDVDGDGKFDLFASGHEWENAPTLVAINPGNNDFSGVTPVTLPTVANEGVVLDVVATGTAGARVLWVLRTSGGDGTFYQSTTVQRVTWPSLSSSVPLLNRGAIWVPWIIPTIINAQNVIASDDKAVTTILLPQ